jgi:hypothetical protein
MAVAKNKSQKKTAPPRPKSWQDAVNLHFVKIPEIDAVFTASDNNVVHVFSVVREFKDSVYDKLLKKERLIEKAFPEISFEYHVRAHQGRKPSLAVPFGAEAVFLR